LRLDGVGVERGQLTGGLWLQVDGGWVGEARADAGLVGGNPDLGEALLLLVVRVEGQGALFGGELWGGRGRGGLVLDNGAARSSGGKDHRCCGQKGERKRPYNTRVAQCGANVSGHLVHDVSSFGFQLNSIELLSL
jgi:hypothetical protein